MSLESAFSSLGLGLAALQDHVSALHVTIAEDKPARGATLLVDQLDNLVTELLGTLEEVGEYAAEAQQSCKTARFDQARHSLNQVHNLFNDFMAQYANELAGHDQMATLLAMGRERGREWYEWSQEVKRAVKRCAPAVKATADTLAEVWSELSLRLAQGSVSLNSTNIGQQITLREGQLDLVAPDT